MNKLAFLGLALALPLAACTPDTPAETAAEAGTEAAEGMADSLETMGEGTMMEAEMDSTADVIRDSAEAVQDGAEAADSTMPAPGM